MDKEEDKVTFYGNWDYYNSPEEKEKVKNMLLKWKDWAFQKLNKDGGLKCVGTVWIENSYPRPPSLEDCSTLGLRLEVHE